MDEIHIKNGLTCYIHKQDNSIIHNGIMAALIVRAGSNNEGVNEQGISHFLEHMTVYPMSWFSFIQEVRLEPMLYAYTNFSETVYVFMNRIKEDENRFFTGCFNTIKHILNGDFLFQVSMPYVREEVLREYEVTDFNKSLAIRRLFLSESYNIKLPIGDISCIKGFNHHDLISYHKKFYLPENAAVVIVGDINVQQAEDSLNNVFSECYDQGSVIKNLIPMLITEQKRFYAEEENEIYNTDNSSLCFLSKMKREWNCLSKHMEDTLCMHLAFDTFKLVLCSYLEEKDMTAFDINGSVEVFSHDWYIVRLDIAFESDIRLCKEQILNDIKNLKPDIDIFNRVKTDFMEVVNTDPEQDVFQLLGEYIQHYLYQEPILDLEDEIKQINQAMPKINYNRVSERVHEIIENLVLV